MFYFRMLYDSNPMRENMVPVGQQLSGPGHIDLGDVEGGLAWEGLEAQPKGGNPEALAVGVALVGVR